MLTGLRPRLLLALVATSAVTLLAAALALLSPLQHRLRTESRTSLRSSVQSARPQLNRDAQDEGRLEADAESLAVRTGSTYAVYRLGPDGRQPELPPTDDRSDVLSAFATGRLVDTQSGDGISLALPLGVQLKDRVRTPSAVLSIGKQDTNLTSTVAEVRRAFVTAAAIGLGVALAIGLVLAATLTRRLARLRDVARQIVEGDQQAPAPADATRDEVGDVARAMATMQQVLQRQEEARRRFVATASHELRTPLTSLSGTLELLGEDLDGADVDVTDARAQVRAASVQAQRLQQLASELLDLSRLDAGLALRSEPVELVELVRAVDAEFAHRAAEAGRSVEVVVPPGPCWARGDPVEVARIARILIDNALRYSPPGAPVVVEPAYHGETATLAVSDEGPGVPEHERDAIFERFRRGTGVTAGSGFGLGLAIGRELAERQGGTLRYEPVGDGARFVLRLPIELPAGGSAQAADAGQPVASG